MLCLKIFLSFVLILCAMMHSSQGYSVLGGRNHFDQSSWKNPRNRPIFMFCDELGNHLNCMLHCKSLGHTNGHCASDFLCNCL